MRLPIHVAKSRTTVHTDSSSRPVYENGPHSGEIDHQSVVAKRTSTYVVPAAANRCQQIICSREIDGRDYVGNACTPGDQSGLFEYASIPDLSGFVVAGISGLENLATNVERKDVMSSAPIDGTKLYSSKGIKVQPGLDLNGLVSAYPSLATRTTSSFTCGAIATSAVWVTALWLILRPLTQPA